MFNDNCNQWEYAGLNPTHRQMAGLGNACARPFEPDGHAVGLPTGPFGSLNERHMIRFPGDDGPVSRTAKDIIDEAIARTTRLFVANSDKDTLYYSIDPEAAVGDLRIGLAIFKDMVGDDVVDYITKGIHEIPSKVHSARRSATTLT